MPPPAFQATARPCRCGRSSIIAPRCFPWPLPPNEKRDVPAARTVFTIISCGVLFLVVSGVFVSVQHPTNSSSGGGHECESAHLESARFALARADCALQVADHPAPC